MNIEPLYTQARLLAGRRYGFDATNLNVAEELVRLVVQECVRIVEPSTDQRKNQHYYLGGVEAVELLDEIAQTLREHFGVEP